MNIENDAGYLVVAKTCGCNGSARKVSYAFVDQEHALCVDKKDILTAEIEACERLLKYASEESDRKAIERELSELRIALDLLT
jgi:hypothetical protein